MTKFRWILVALFLLLNGVVLYWRHFHFDQDAASKQGAEYAAREVRDKTEAIRGLIPEARFRIVRSSDRRDVTVPRFQEVRQEGVMVSIAEAQDVSSYLLLETIFGYETDTAKDQYRFATKTVASIIMGKAALYEGSADFMTEETYRMDKNGQVVSMESIATLNDAPSPARVWQVPLNCMPTSPLALGQPWKIVGPAPPEAPGKKPIVEGRFLEITEFEGRQAVLVEARADGLLIKIAPEIGVEPYSEDRRLYFDLQTGELLWSRQQSDFPGGTGRATTLSCSASVAPSHTQIRSKPMAMPIPVSK